jgi:hypothetical protein
MKEKLAKIFLNFRFILILYILLAIIASAQSYFQGTKFYNDKPYLHYNNYSIFKHSYFHLLEGSSLYRHYPDEYYDLYKYSPTFSLFFGTMAWMPDLAGLLVWNLLNALLLILAIKLLQGLSNKYKIWILFFVIFEMVGSLQNEQSNSLMAGFIILAFALLEKRKYGWASFLIVFSVFIKLFGIVAFALYIFYPKKSRLLSYTAIWFVLFLAAPLLVTGFSDLIYQYQEWGVMLSNDHSESLGISIFGIMQTWFHLGISKYYILVAGIILFLIPMFMFNKHEDLEFRLKALASILIWVIIFNHKAESPTFVIAMCGIGIYLFNGSFNNIKLSLLIFSLLFTSIMFQDFIPKSFRNEYIIAYNLKALPSVVIWFMLIWQMLFMKKQSEEIAEN